MASVLPWSSRRQISSRKAVACHPQRDDGNTSTEDPLAAKVTTSEAVDFSESCGGADRIVVIATVATGVFVGTDQIIEIVLVTLGLTGTVLDVWETLVRPSRAISTTSTGGISESMLQGAPYFEEIAGDVASRLDGACPAGHDLSFDLEMLSREFELLDANLTTPAGFDTLIATRMRLSLACEAHGVEYPDDSSAKGDALATVELLRKVVAQCNPGAAAAAPAHLQRSGRVLRRGDAHPISIFEPRFIAERADTFDDSPYPLSSWAPPERDAWWSPTLA